MEVDVILKDIKTVNHKSSEFVKHFSILDKTIMVTLVLTLDSDTDYRFT